MTKRITGRHRRPGRLSTATNNLTRTAAIAATSTGLLAGTAVSATATPEVGHEPVSFVQEPSAAPAESLQRLVEAGLLSEKAITLDSPARAVAAPADVDGVDFGTSGFTAVTRAVEAPAEPEAATEAPAQAETSTSTSTETAAAAAVESRTETSASRDNARTSPAPAAPSTPAPAPAPSTPAPQPAPAPSVGGGVLGIAAAYTGYPYVNGGGSPASGFDCSGYTSYVFAQVGVSLPRTAAGQQAATTPVSNPQPGDLVFFGYPAYHVGIYAGNGMMYDSGNPGTGVVYRAVFSGVSGYGRV